MNRLTFLFASISFVLFAGAYAWILLATPLTLTQSVGVAVAFVLGWAGLAFAGGHALHGMAKDQAPEYGEVRPMPVRTGR